MKNAVLLLLLLPFIGFSQNPIVRWHGIVVNYNPTTQPSYFDNSQNSVEATNITGQGINFNYNGYNGFEGSNWSSSAITPDTEKYFLLTIKPKAGKQIDFTKLQLTYKGQCKKMRVSYAKSPNTNVTFTDATSLDLIGLNPNNNDVTVNFILTGANTHVIYGETLQVRIYGYESNGGIWMLRDGVSSSPNANGPGPALYGTISDYVAAVMTANNDSYDIELNNSRTLNVLSNDAAANTVTRVTATNPSHGTLVINTDKTITYTPAASYTGADSFTYTITNGTTTSTATVALNVAAVAPTAALNGTYYIGTNGHFATLTAAVASLNTYGIAGPVTFLLKNATYGAGETFPLTINPIANSSAVNTVTFKPYTGVNPVITATNANNSTGIPAIFYLNGADFITFDGSNTANGTTKNFTLDNQDNIDYIQRSVFWIASNGSNGATHITIRNCNIKQSVINQGGAFSVGVYSGNNGIGNNNTMNIAAATANNSDLTVTNNDFMSVKQGVYVNGTSALTTNVLINRNDLGATTNAETIIAPATLINVNGFEYSDNLVNNLYRSTNDGDLVSAGIYVAGASKNGSILRNTMKDLTKTTTNSQTFGGIVLSSTDFNANILVANNFILNVTGDGNGGGYLNGYGIIADNGGGYKIYNNTVVLRTNQPHGGFSAPFYVNATARNLDVRNNIFANNQTNTATRRSAIVVKNTLSNINTVFTNLDYNDYYSNDRIAYISNVNSLGQIDWAGNGVQGSYEDNADYTYTLQAWKNITAKDAHSSNVNPAFASATDLHLDVNNGINAGINNTATPLADVTRDIDNQLRSTITPDMGADEFGPNNTPEAGDPAGIYCDNATTWNGTSWSNGQPAANKDVIFNADYTQAGGNFYACSIYILAGKNVNFISNSNAIVTHAVNVAETGTLTFESSSNLVQIENDANTGTVTVKRNSGRLRRLDYTMWTAPVVDKRATGFQTLQSFSPATALNRFYQYMTSTEHYETVPAETTKFALGKGYLIRMPNTDAATGYGNGGARIIYNGVFTGTPNNGNITVPVEYYSPAYCYNGVGNPYPSPISVQAFINANLNNIEGTLWIWRKTNDATVSSYATVNLSGYTANAAAGGNTADGNDLIADPYAIDPRGSLNTAQGFVVKAKANTNIVFNNNMRLQTNSNTFFRTAAPESVNRIWLNASSTTGEFSQSLVAYNDASTTGYDNGYDGKALINGNLNLYSIVQTATDTLNLTIQARGTFTTTDRVQMGLKAEAAGTYTIAIDHTDGVFAGNQDVFLIDTVEGITRNLRTSSYTFSTEAGTFNNRFMVTYAPQGALGTDTPVLDTKEVVVYKDGKQVKITAPADINTVTVYDMLGKTLFQKSNIDGMSFATTEINAGPQVIIVQITLDNQQVISKKIMMN